MTLASIYYITILTSCASSYFTDIPCFLRPGVFSGDYYMSSCWWEFGNRAKITFKILTLDLTKLLFLLRLFAFEYSSIVLLIIWRAPWKSLLIKTIRLISESTLINYLAISSMTAILVLSLNERLDWTFCYAGISRLRRSMIALTWLFNTRTSNY